MIRRTPNPNMKKTRKPILVSLANVTLDGRTPHIRTVDVMSGPKSVMIGRLKLELYGEFVPDHGDGHRFRLHMSGTLTINGISVDVSRTLKVPSPTRQATYVYDPALPESWRYTHDFTRRTPGPNDFLGSSDIPDGVRNTLHHIQDQVAQFVADSSGWRDAADLKSKRDTLDRMIQERAELLEKADTLTFDIGVLERELNPVQESIR